MLTAIDLIARCESGCRPPRVDRGMRNSFTAVVRSACGGTCKRYIRIEGFDAGFSSCGESEYKIDIWIIPFLVGVKTPPSSWGKLEHLVRA